SRRCGDRRSRLDLAASLTEYRSYAKRGADFSFSAPHPALAVRAALSLHSHALKCAIPICSPGHSAWGSFLTQSNFRCGTESARFRAKRNMIDENARLARRRRERERYANDPEYRERKRQQQRERMRKRYATDPEYRELLLERQRKRQRKRYANDPEYREQL